MKFVSRSIVDQNQEQEIRKDGNQEGSSNDAPQEDYDPRTLYERLQEQKNMKEEMFQEQTRLSNLIKRVDDEEAEYYQTLSDVQEKLDMEKRRKESEELEAFRKAVEQTRHTVATSELPTTTTTTSAAPSSSSTTGHKQGRRRSSKNALDGLVVVKKKKRSADEKEDEEKQDDKHQAKKAKPTTTTTTKTAAEQKKGGSTAAAAAAAPSSSTGGLSSLMAAYSSDSDEEDDE